MLSFMVTPASLHGLQGTLLPGLLHFMACWGRALPEPQEEQRLQHPQYLSHHCLPCHCRPHHLRVSRSPRRPSQAFRKAGTPGGAGASASSGGAARSWGLEQHPSAHRGQAGNTCGGKARARAEGGRAPWGSAPWGSEASLGRTLTRCCRCCRRAAGEGVQGDFLNW